MKPTAAELAYQYFTPPSPVFWRWAGNGCAEIEGTWKPPTLIAFREELISILKALEIQGWPPLSLILLLLAATRESWPASRVHLRSQLDVRFPSNPFVTDLLEQLDHVQALPESLRVSLVAKVRLVTVVFEGSNPALSAEQTPHALQFLNQALPKFQPDYWQERTTEETHDDERFASWSRRLRIGLARLTEESLRLRHITGLDEAVVAAPVEVPPSKTSPLSTHAARLWAWSHDPQLYGVARIARRLMSVMSWPRRVGQPNDLPLGGVSDLSNRGPLDRLLLSELAQDDDALMVRIALNEALYLRRECPREEGPHHRSILIDAGLRMWGCPRVFGAAVALAMAAGEDRDKGLSVTVTVTARDGCQTVDVRTRDGVLQLLSTLSPALHPGRRFAEWLESHLDEEDHELVLITSSEVMPQAEFQQSLAQLPVRYRLALVDGNGRFELKSHTAHGWRTEQTATLNLEELLEPPATPRALPLSTRLPDRFPAICRTASFPLLLTHQWESQQAFPIGTDRLVTLASGGRVLLWSPAEQGGRQLALETPRGRIETWSTTVENVAYAVVRAKSKWVLLTIDVDLRTCQHVELSCDWPATDPTVRAVVLPECVAILSNKGFQAFDLETGVQLASTHDYSLRTFRFRGNRYLYDIMEAWFRLSFDGAWHLDHVKTADDTLLLVDPPATFNHDQPLEIPSAGVRESVPGKVPPFFASDFKECYQIGSLVILGGKFEMLNHRSTYRTQSAAIWDLNRPGEGWTQLPYFTGRVADAVHIRIASRFRFRPALRTKFRGLCYVGSRVALISSKGKICSLLIRNGHLVLAADKSSSPEAASLDRQTIPFETVRMPRASLHWHTAVLPNGNTVWLDSRGLLHLVPADWQQLEITLVLSDSRLSGWISDGRQFGDEYYLTVTKGELVPDQTVWSQLIAPFFGVEP